MLQLSFPTFPVLLTERLILRQLQPEDCVEIHRMRSNREVNELLGRSNSTGIEDAAAFIENIQRIVLAKEGIYWAIAPKGEVHLIGTICFWNLKAEHNTMEVGFELLPEWQGKGYMKEALQAVLAFGFQQMSADHITADVAAVNLRSIHLLLKTGFKPSSSAAENFRAKAEGLLALSLHREGYQQALVR